MKLEVKDKAIRPVRRGKQLVITPKRIVLGVFILFLILVVWVFYWQISFLIKAPELEVIQPPADITVKEETFEIIGNTDPAVYLTVNGQEVYIDKEGGFKTLIELSEGVNTIEIQTQNRFNKTNQIIRRIIYQP